MELNTLIQSLMILGGVFASFLVMFLALVFSMAKLLKSIDVPILITKDEDVF